MRVVLLRAENSEGIPRAFSDQPEPWIDRRKTLYETALAEALAVCGSYDADDDGVVSSAEKTRNIGQMWITR
jgi:hypothetical protein